jgi:hypothetical protein
MPFTSLSYYFFLEFKVHRFVGGGSSVHTSGASSGMLSFLVCLACSANNEYYSGVLAVEPCCPNNFLVGKQLVQIPHEKTCPCQRSQYLYRHRDS